MFARVDRASSGVHDPSLINRVIDFHIAAVVGEATGNVAPKVS